MDVSGKVAVVTGASRGIGRAIAQRLAECGADVALLYAGNHEAANEALSAVREHGRKAEIYCCDVGNGEDVSDVMKRVIDDFGRVDIVVNNAGITRDNLLLKMSEEDFDEVLRVNLKGAFNVTKAVYQPFMRQRSGRIINISSVVGLFGNAGQANYAAAKAALFGFTKSTAKELAARGVTCNAIAPGFIETEMTGKLSEKVQEAMLSAIPAKRYGSPREVADLVVFLASDSAAYITGEVLRVDGGMAM